MRYCFRCTTNNNTQYKRIARVSVNHVHTVLVSTTIRQLLLLLLLLKLWFSDNDVRTSSFSY